MSRFGFSPLIFHWMLDFGLAPYLQFSLNSRMVRPNRLFAEFLACTGSLFGCTIYAYPLARKRI